MTSKSEVKVGDSVIFIDSVRRRVPALVQAVHGNGGCINIVHVSTDDNRTDQYGRQTEHVTSISHHTDQHPTVGHCWCYPDEDVVIDESNVQTQR